MLPKAHKTISVEINADGQSHELRGPEARGFVRMFQEDIGKGAAEVGTVSVTHESGTDTFPLHEDGSLRLAHGSARAALGLPEWLREVRRGEKPVWPPKSK